MRLFFSLKVPSDVSEVVRKETKILEKYGKLANDCHITLKFLGDVDENKMDKIIKRAKDIREGSILIKTKSKLSTIDPGKIRVIYLDIEENKVLERLAEKIDEATKEIKIDHKFKPHITICRIKKLKGKEEFEEQYIERFIEELKKDVEKIELNEFEFHIGEFFLMKSILNKEGAVHEIVESFGLG